MMSDDKLIESKDSFDLDSVETKLLRSTADLIESKSATLDGATSSKLHQARSAALEQAKNTQWNWMPLGGAVTAAALLTVILQVGPDWRNTLVTEPLPQLVDAEPANIDDLELLASAVDLELLEELEFYMWLDSNEGIEA